MIEPPPASRDRYSFFFTFCFFIISFEINLQKKNSWSCDLINKLTDIKVIGDNKNFQHPTPFAHA